MPTDMLAEYFSNNEVLKNIFKTAIEFESIAMARALKTHLEAPIEIKSFIGVLLDFYGIDRVKFSQTVE
jgi:hypothetical protein